MYILKCALPNVPLLNGASSSKIKPRTPGYLLFQNVHLKFCRLLSSEKMSSKTPTSLGVECGATSSTAIVLFADGSTETIKLGPANFKLLTRTELQEYFVVLRDTVVQQCGIQDFRRVGVGMPGILTSADKKVVEQIVKSIWSNLDHIWTGSDLETALACLQSNNQHMRFIIICGTGSCCYGSNGITCAKVGGNGHIVGDCGSGYAIGLAGLRAAVKEYEHENKSILLKSLMKVLNVDTTSNLVGKVTAPNFSKADMAALVPAILEEWVAGNPTAVSVVQTAIHDLTTDAVILAKKLTTHETKSVQIGLTGSVLTESVDFQSEFVRRLKSLITWLTVDIEILKNTAKGALKMISNIENSENNNNTIPTCPHPLSESDLRELILPVSTSLSPTECRNPKSSTLDKMPISDALHLWLDEESSFYSQISKEKPRLERIIRRVTQAFQMEGRLFYVGAGTSGRLGILDASECPPTFKTPPHWVQGIIAGGNRAVRTGIEGAEDSIIDGMKAVEDHGINSKDIVIGIAASGRTPFVWGALYKAKELGSFTCLLAFNPNMTMKHKPDEVMLVNVGPEILTGSTRLKSGSATKCILNMITSLALVQYGKCLENLMVDLMPTNQKLKERALRIVLIIMNFKTDDGDVLKEVAQAVLVKHNYDIKKTVSELQSLQ